MAVQPARIADFALSGPCACAMDRLPSRLASPHAASICASVIVLRPPSRMLPLAKILTKSAPSSLIHVSTSIRIRSGVPVLSKIWWIDVRMRGPASRPSLIQSRMSLSTGLPGL